MSDAPYVPDFMNKEPGKKGLQRRRGLISVKSLVGILGIFVLCLFLLSCGEDEEQMATNNAIHQNWYLQSSQLSGPMTVKAQSGGGYTIRMADQRDLVSVLTINPASADVISGDAAEEEVWQWSFDLPNGTYDFRALPDDNGDLQGVVSLPDETEEIMTALQQYIDSEAQRITTLTNIVPDPEGAEAGVLVNYNITFDAALTGAHYGIIYLSAELDADNLGLEQIPYTLELLTDDGLGNITAEEVLSLRTAPIDAPLSYRLIAQIGLPVDYGNSTLEAEIIIDGTSMTTPFYGQSNVSIPILPFGTN